MNRITILLATVTSLALFSCGTSTYAVIEPRPGSESEPLLFKLDRLAWDGDDLEVRLGVHNNTRRVVVADRRFMILEEGPRKVAPRSVVSRYRLAPYSGRTLALHYPGVPATERAVFSIDFLAGAFRFESGDERAIEIAPLRFRIQSEE